MSDDIKLKRLGKEIPLMVFDVESIGLHGEAFAVGYVVIHHGNEADAGLFACPTIMAEGVDSDRDWVSNNIPFFAPNCACPASVRDAFWQQWMDWKRREAVLAAECAWPVESRFLAGCVDGFPMARKFSGPYPLLEISTWMLAAKMDPIKIFHRLESELPRHNPLADARQSARLLMEAIAITERLGV